jgi:hypothetical protein
MDRYVLCYDGTRIYFQLAGGQATASCEKCGFLDSGVASAVEQKVNGHAYSTHQGKHSVT